MSGFRSITERLEYYKRHRYGSVSTREPDSAALSLVRAEGARSVEGGGGGGGCGCPEITWYALTVARKVALEKLAGSVVYWTGLKPEHFLIDAEQEPSTVIRFRLVADVPVTDKMRAHLASGKLRVVTTTGA